MANIGLLWKSTATPLAGVGRVRAIPPPRTPSILRVISTPSSLNLSWRCLKISAQAIPLPLQIQPQPKPKPTIYEIFKALKKSATVLFLIAGLLLSNPICAAASLSVSEEVLPQTDETTKKELSTLAEVMLIILLPPTLLGLQWLHFQIRRNERNHFVVGKVQVAFPGTATSLQTDLIEYMDASALFDHPLYLYSDHQKALFYELISTMLRHKDHCISVHSSGCVENSFGAASRRFDELKIKKQAKSSKEPTKNDGLKYIVVTILLIIEGYQKMPTIDRSRALESALRDFDCIPLSRIWGYWVELNPPLSEKDFHEQYPLLKPLYRKNIYGTP